jgi:UDP-N-acetylmuramoyl-L-alanyl-D-glutamate--2,6-diaminopimelate ligase
MKKILNFYHFLLGCLSAFVYRFPSREIFVLGVTGTKGKSSVLELINTGLEAAGYKTALSSSIRIKIGNYSESNKTGNSMPGRFFLQKFLRQAVDDGCRYALIEVTSEGTRQHRARFIDFDAAMITNLRPEHIESHGGFENYRAAKGKFFRDVVRFSKKSPKNFFVNENDYNSIAYFTEAAGGKAISYGKSDYAVNLLGEFNKENAGAAVAFLKKVCINEDIIKKALGSFTDIPGRLEFVQKFPFSVIVDYAHTPDSLEAVYKTLKEKTVKTDKKLICVLGSAGGGRDKWKRPKMGAVAANYCDEIILTDEDSYDESPASIMKDIEKGFAEVPGGKFKSPSDYWKIISREEAIRRAVSIARQDDIVIITGKGSEQTIHKANGVVLPWSDKKTARKLLAEMFS